MIDINIINVVSKNLSDAINNINVFVEHQDEYISKIRYVLHMWTGETYIGCRKIEYEKQAFQNFYENFYQFLIRNQNSDVSILSGLSNNVLYTGKLYRYLGYGDYKKHSAHVKPKFDNMWVY